ncbi:creatininase family protein [Nevskia ramosa]|uniref:creatininase family protein n=1 Tax=Nevskia ramosa TaxID=64002 RepID=UPI0003B6A17B|nr:creatininase family protein [Nevskia ramosa]
MSASELQPQLVEWLEMLGKPLLRAGLFMFDQQSPLYLPYLVTSLLFGWLGWRYFERAAPGAIQDFFAKHFSRAQWWHDSARADYRYYFVNAVVFTVLIGPLLLSAAWCADRARDLFQFGLGTGPAWTAGLGSRIAYTVLFFIAYDLGRWIAHSLLHESKLLWEFHKVHHSAEVLTPVTAFRVHPVDLLVTLSVPALTTAPITGLFLYLYADAVTAFSFLGLNFVIGLSGLIANLKHWQVWFRYGPLDGWWISPAHHQIHHSADPRHWGKNRGFELGCWDRWYGSLHIPAKHNEVTAMGFGDGTEPQWHSVRQMMLQPFVAAWKLLSRPARAATAALLVTSLLMLAIPRANAAEPAGVRIEDMTWPELAARIKAGATTVLLPIGGIEQNGPAMAFAKHNRIVVAAADAIAIEAGNTLVAPLVPFSPAGGIAPRSAHMQWPGTISLRESTLNALLEDEVSSLAVAGFTRIALFGDHGGSQPVQDALVKRLNATLASRGVKLISLNRYYEPAPLADRLKALGADPADAGDHAGLVDTSELLSVAPDLIRSKLLSPESWAPYQTPPGPGSSGRPDKASAELGRGLLKQRIDAAVQQLQATTK